MKKSKFPESQIVYAVRQSEISTREEEFFCQMGISEAKKRGIYKGREKGTVETNEYVLESYSNVVRYLRMNKSLRDIASRYEICLGTVQKVIRMIAYFLAPKPISVLPQK